MTLLEVLIGTFIVSVVLVSAGWALSSTTSSKQIHAEEPLNAALLAREIYELAMTLPTAPSGLPVADAPGEALALDTLDGASFQPPIDSRQAAMASLGTWKQRVQIQVFDLADPEVAALDGYAQIAGGAGQIYRLVVTIEQRKIDLGTWWWWVNP
ncbi:MAG: type IV pilus modification PilV family protein [Planctomycetota bacterium]